ncbi:unannotated protein [freshwater metagenome]|uniref:Unannotated protein n=1 Tax=freshwater metagenome TaxID=449393 RepID=A0A6J7JI90_9ZZZZ
MPGPCNPMELSIPEGVSAILGVGLPDRALTMIDLVTIAPISFNGKNCDNSLPEPAHPLAVKIGLGKLVLLKDVAKSKLDMWLTNCSFWNLTL